jgi:hypothetical protein
MGKTKRDNLKRTLAQACHSLDGSLVRIAELEEIFRPVHPDLADGLIAAAQLIADAETVLETFALVSWNVDRKTLETYR